ncbi:UNVERIFIED_CONTAM: carboxypeptidase regulatory-like domain-containing protein, partial [Bacillus mycoides]
MKKSIVSVLMFAGMFTYAQVTTSIISGNVKDGSSKPVVGSTVVLVHEPSGTRYVTKTNSKGEYTLPNVRVGGPYKITVTAAGIGETEQTDIYTSLGTNSTVDVVLSKASATKIIDEVVIRSTKNPIINSKATGAATTIGREALNRTPTVG